MNRSVASLLLAALLLLPAAALAQNASGSISAIVADRSGAVVPNAKVVLQNEATNATRDTTTNGAGLFTFPAVQPGSYTVTVTAAGLQTSQRTGIAMTQGANMSMGTITLEVAQTQTQVEVLSASDVIVPVDSPQASQTLTTRMVE